MRVRVKRRRRREGFFNHENSRKFLARTDRPQPTRTLHGRDTDFARTTDRTDRHVPRPALRNCVGGSPGAKRHTKITPGEEARSATQPGVRDSPKPAPEGRYYSKWKQQVEMDFSKLLKAFDKTAFVSPYGRGFRGAAHPRFPRPPGSVTGGYYCAALGLCRRKAQELAVP